MKQKILIYGVGNHTKKLLHFLDYENIEILGFVVSNSVDMENWNGIPIIQNAQIDDIQFDYLIIGCIAYEEEVRYLLRKKKIEEYKVVSGRLTEENIEGNALLFDLGKYSALKTIEICKMVKRLEDRNLFWDMARGIEWFDNNTSLTPGSWAVGYAFLYALAAALDIGRPKKVLECGVGETTKILMQYAEHTKCAYDSFEEDESWYQHFCNKYRKSESMVCHISPTKKVESVLYESEVNIYQSFADELNGKYELISIDGPKGSKEFSRIDILECLPACLEEDFCILVDDYNRIGEQRMVKEMEKIFDYAGIRYRRFLFGGGQLCIICSDKYKFLGTIGIH